MTKKRRTLVKYPNLKREYNTKARTDSIETEYIDGVYDQNGTQVIRPLNDEELAWLDQFYGEVVAQSSKKLNPTEEIESYVKARKKAKQSLAKERKKGKEARPRSISFYLNKISKIEECLDFLREEAGVFYPSCEDQRRLYKENNTRNYCVYNNRKIRGMLLELTEDNYDHFIGQYWQALKNITGEDSQDRMIDQVEENLRGTFLPHEFDDTDDHS